MDYQRKILDELMGQNRNLTPKDGPNQGQRWTDEDVCKNYLVDFCPHELFTNTRSDLGHCDKIHDDAMKHDYQKSDRKGKMGYEEDFANYLAKILVDLDRRIRNGRDRLSRAASKEPSPSPGTEGDSKMAALDKKIQEYLQRAEACGEEGKVDEAQTLTKQVESMKAEKEAMKAQIERQINSEKRMEVCDICGAFLVVGDTQKRTDSHLEGKQHTGYDMIRKAYEEYKHLIGSRPQRRDDLERRSSRGPSDRPRDGDRDRDRDYRDRDRDYRDSRDHRDRDRDYRDSRDRDRDYRDRDRDRNGRDRSRRSRSRDRDRSRRSRSRSSSPHRRH